MSITDYDNGITAETEEEREEREGRARLIANLRELADLLELAPELPAPYSMHATVYLSSEAAARRARRRVRGWRKHNTRESYYVTYEKVIGGGSEYGRGAVTLSLEVSKGETCQRVQVGTRHVEAVPAHEEPVYEWDCSGGES